MNPPVVTPMGDAAAVLHTLAAIEPLYWTPFYNRARLYRGQPRPEAPEVIVDLTKDCPFDCSFCFASQTLDSGRRMSPELLRRLEGTLAGVPRLTLVGGEPLTHPHLRDVLAILAAGHEHIEIYSNALALPDEPARRRKWLQDRFAQLPARVTLNVAVDRYHQQQYGVAEYARKIDAMLDLAADPEAPLEVRFNVTADGLSTAGYLVVDRIERCLAELHEGLLDLFRQALRAGRADQRFQFNPVIRLGRAADAAGEYLQAEDALFEPQVVLGPTAQGGAELLSSLPATWMPEPPALLRHGPADQDSLAGQLQAEFVKERLGAWHAPALATCFRWLHACRQGQNDATELAEQAVAELSLCDEPPASELVAAILTVDVDTVADLLRVASARTLAADWPNQGDGWLDRTAQRLHRLCGKGGQGWSLSAERPHRRLMAPVLWRFLALHLADHTAAAEAFTMRCVALATEALAAAATPGYTGYRRREGLITDPPDAPLPLREVPLDQGVATPYFGDALIRPRLVINLSVNADGLVEFELDGLGAVPLAPQTDVDEAVDSYQHLLGVLLWVLPPALVKDFEGQLASRLSELLKVAGSNSTWAELLRRCQEASPMAPEDPPKLSRKDLARLLLGKAHAAL